MLASLTTDRVICDRYRIRGVLGKGGMGVVFKAEDLALRRMVALKILTLQSSLTGAECDPHREERFLREASLGAQIAHPNVVTIFDYGHGDEGNESFCYIAMELLIGETLGDRLRRNTDGLPMAETLRFMTQVARGLRAAHQHGLVHRDLKPDNIMLTPGEDAEEVARILDFGLVKDTRAVYEAGLTDDGTIMGTPEYMAPEQVESRPVDVRTDLYAVGIVLYECLTGQPPFRRENAFRVAAAQVRDLPPQLRTALSRPRPSLALRELVSRLLEKKPEARIQTAEELLTRLRDLPESRALQSHEAAEAISLATSSRYQTGRKLSESSRATVFEATHLELGRQVAIKIFRASSPVEVARLMRELPALAVLRRPSNTRVLDIGVTPAKAGGRPFLVMERVRGQTLRAILLKQGMMPWRRAVDIGVAILDALGEAHAVGLLHRHVTPEHVLVSGAEAHGDAVKLVGYRLPEGEAEQEDQGPSSLPDPDYTAPEVVHGAAMNERADLYGVGAILHECIAGRAPGPRGIASRVQAPSAAEMPPELADVLRRAMSLDPAERFESAAEFAAALASIHRRSDSPADHAPDSAPPLRAVSIVQRRLRSTGQPTLWALMDDPALRRSPVTDVLAAARATMRVEEISADHRVALAERLLSEDEMPPWVVLFGGMHVILEDPVLAALASAPEASRLLVSTHANTELLEAAINFCGLDHHITLPAPADVLRSAIERMVARSGSVRRYYDDLRLLVQRAAHAPAALARGNHVHMSSH